MNAFLIFTYIWSVIIILDIINKRVYKHYSKPLRSGMPGRKYQLIYCYKVYTPLDMIFRVLTKVCYFFYCFTILVVLEIYLDKYPDIAHQRMRHPGYQRIRRSTKETSAKLLIN